MEQLLLIPETPPKGKIRKVVLSALPPNNQLYCAAPPHGMTESMRILGLLQPIGVIENTGGPYKICWGRKRIVTARQLGWISIEAKVYEPGMSAQELMTLVENEQRRESLEVKMSAVETMRRSLPDEEICQLAGLSKKAMKQIVTLIDGLIPELRQALREGRIAPGTAVKAIRLTRDQQRQLAAQNKIRGQDINSLIQAKMSTFLEQMPEVLFEMPDAPSWQNSVQSKLQEIKSLIPKDRPDITRTIEQVNECLNQELLVY